MSVRSMQDTKSAASAAPYESSSSSSSSDATVEQHPTSNNTAQPYESSSSSSSSDATVEQHPTSNNTTQPPQESSPFQFFSTMAPQQILAISLLTLNTVLLFADQNLMAPNLSAMAAEFGFDDEERDRKLGGDIALAFFVLGAPISLLIGCGADVVQRRTRLFALTILVGEGACGATYGVRTYGQLYVCRAVTGVSVGGALPLVFSILGDMFPARQRHAVSSCVGIGSGVGIFLGQGVAGFLGPSMGWRVPFLVVSAPALVCALAFWLLVEDPERGCMEEANSSILPTQRSNPTLIEQGQSPTESKETDTSDGMSADDASCSTPTHPSPLLRHLQLQLRTFWTLTTTPTFVLLLLQGAPGCVPWGIVNVFLADYLAVDRHMSVEGATVVLLVFGVGVFLGMLMGGFWGSALYRRDKRYPALLAGVTSVLGCLPFWGLLNTPSSGPWMLRHLYAFSFGVLSAMTGPNVKATLQNTTLPAMRGQAFALFNTFDDFGRGLGPVFVAGLIRTLGGRLAAFNVGTGLWLVCGVLNLCTFFTIRADEEKVQQRMIATRQEDDRRHHHDQISLIQMDGIGSPR